MHLKSLGITNFRSCLDTIISFQSDLTVLVGENNGGKSNIIDAIRLLTLPLNGRRDRYPEDDDLLRGSKESEFRIEGQYAELSPTVKGLLISGVPDPTKDVAFFGMRYETKVEGSIRGRTSCWAGQFIESEPEHGSTDLIRHVYLPPLRDAQKVLGSGSATHIVSLLKHFIGDNEAHKEEFLEHVKRDGDPHDVVKEINTQIESALDSLTNGVRPQTASLDFHAEELFDVARDLRFRLADAGIYPEEIRSSGLGYANLLYMATVIVELTKAREADLTLFLVEEPEAHLHPQLQMLVLEFLLEQARESSRLTPVSGKPEGRIQIIVTTHSPNLTAWVSPKHLGVVRSVKMENNEITTHQTVCVSVAGLGLKPKALNKVSRYLDVTRSALLFGNRAFLVEGVSESILVPIIAQHAVLEGDPDAWRRFRGVVVVSIEGVDFKPYVEILLRRYENASIADLVVVVTDADPKVPGNRKNDLEELSDTFGSRDKLQVFVNERTLEHELFQAGNEKLLKNSFLSLHPRSGDDWKTRIEDMDEENRADAFVSLLADKKTRKGDLAQEVASRISKGAPLNVPEYLVKAIKALVAT
ncbi:MAG: AAA family ATPase [Candidatus Thiodiazotropha endolucinida]